MNSNYLQNKKGLLGSFVVMFIATVLIVLILVVFVLGAAVVKKVNKVGAGVRIYNEESVEIDNIFDYMGRYTNLLRVKFFMEKGLSLDESFAEGGYEE